MTHHGPRAGRVAVIMAALLAGGLSGLEYARYRRDMRQARVDVATGSRIAETACGPIEYGAAGDGPPVLLVHGAGGGYDQGIDFGQPLVGRGFRIIAMSRFGYLRTPLPSDASAAAQADAHASLLDQLGISRAAIVGASAGAPSSMQFALRHPERCGALVLLVPAAYRPGAGDAPLRAPAGTRFLFETALRSDFLLWAATRYARSTMIQAILATPLPVVADATAEERARLGRILKRMQPVSARRRGLLNDAAMVLSLQRYDLEHISAPTLVIGVSDCLFGTFEPARYTAQHIPGARFKSFATGGHLWVGHEGEVVAEIAAFLKEGQAGRDGVSPAFGD